VRERLAHEGVAIDPTTGRADQDQRWTPEDWVAEAESTELPDLATGAQTITPLAANA
jgi:hypothetical protein